MLLFTRFFMRNQIFDDVFQVFQVFQQMFLF